MRKAMNLLAISFMVFLLSGCSLFEPSTNKMTELIQNALSPNKSTSFLVVKNMVKTNGVKSGDNKYTAYLQYDLYFTKSYKDLMSAAKRSSDQGPASPNNMDELKAELGAFAKIAAISALALRFGEFKANTFAHITAEITFIKSDNGWILAKNQNLLSGGILGN